MQDEYCVKMISKKKVPIMAYNRQNMHKNRLKSKKKRNGDNMAEMFGILHAHYKNVNEILNRNTRESLVGVIRKSSFSNRFFYDKMTTVLETSIGEFYGYNNK